MSPPGLEVGFGEEDGQQAVFFYYWVVNDIVEKALEAFSGKDFKYEGRSATLAGL
jgi:hypothetical protein